MDHRYSGLALVFVATAIASLVMVLPAAGQALRVDDANATEPAWTGARTPWGVPDLQGIWDFRTITPLQRPDDLADKSVPIMTPLLMSTSRKRLNTKQRVSRVSTRTNALRMV